MLNKDWQFHKYTESEQADNLIYDVRPEVKGDEYDKAADVMPT